MSDTTFTTPEETSKRDLVIAGAMLLVAVAAFWYLDTRFHVSTYFWYSLMYVLLLLPFVGLILHARPFLLKLAFATVLATAVFIL